MVGQVADGAELQRVSRCPSSRIILLYPAIRWRRAANITHLLGDVVSRKIPFLSH